MIRIILLAFVLSLSQISLADKGWQAVQAQRAAQMEPNCHSISGAAFLSDSEECVMTFRNANGAYSTTAFSYEEVEQMRGCPNVVRVDGNLSCDRVGQYGSHVITSSGNQSGQASKPEGGYGAECAAKLEVAQRDCNFNDNPGIKTATTMASQMKKQIDAAASSSLQSACSGLGTLSQTVNEGLAGYKTYCSAGYGECSDACEQDLKKVSSDNEINKAVATDEMVSAVRKNKNKCDALANNIAEASQNLMTYMNVGAQMKNCSLLTGSSLASQCASNPSSSPLCMSLTGSTDCSNPQVAATNKVCRCQANPAGEGCSALTTTVGSLGGAKTDYGSGADGAGNNLGAFGGPGGGFDNSSGLGIDPGKTENPDGRSLKLGGSGKANVSESGGGHSNGGGKPGAGGGGGGSALNAKVIGGYGFGAGGGGASGGSGGGSSSAYRSGGYGNGTGAAGGSRVDLRQFLPGGRLDPSRGLAGISGPDGITGPNSDIWKKINARYFAVTPSLLP